MSDEKKPVIITIDGKEWPITLGTNELIEVEELTGLNVLMGPVNLLLPSFGLLRALLFVALKGAGAVEKSGKPTYSIPEAGEFIGSNNAVSLRDAFIAAWSGETPAPAPAASNA